MIPAAATDLYALPIDQFIAGRDRLAKELAEEGRGDESVEVARLRKPTTDAWALNQVARRHPELVEGLVQVHRELRQANDPRALREAAEARGRLLEQITTAAAAILVEAGHSAEGTVRDRIGRTLLAAAADESTEHRLQTGTLTRAVEITGGWPNAFAAAPPEPVERDPGSQDAEELERLRARAEASAQRAEELRAEARQAREVLEEARRCLDTAEAAAKEAGREARDAKRAWEEARRSTS